MTLERAVEVLTANRHCGDVEWCTAFNGVGRMAFGYWRRGRRPPIFLSAADAIRLAEELKLSSGIVDLHALIAEVPA